MKKLLVLISNIFSLIISPTHTFAEDASQPYVIRGEFSEKLASVLKEKGLLGKSQHKALFADVTQESEYYDKITLLKELSIVKGDGNGIFRPNDYILYQEAAAMVSRIVATEDIINGLGGYPIGYLRTASKEGLFKGISASITTEVKRKDLQKN